MEIVKRILLYAIGLVVMAGLIVFIARGIRTMYMDQLDTEETKTEAATDDPIAMVTEETTRITTQATTEATTEVTTEITTEAVVEDTTEALTADDDRKDPVFLSIPTSIEVKKGTSFYVNDYVSFADDIDRSPELTIEGEVKTDEIGTYEIKLTLEDDAGHTANGNIKVNVVSDYTPSSSSKEKEDFETFKSIYKNDNTSLGIDVSRWQEDVDYEAVKNAGCEFVIIRIGGYDDGSQYTDRYYKSNIEKARAAGLKVGIYWHAEENSEDQIKDNVKYMMDILDGEPLDFPIAYDWEDFGHFQKYGMSLNDINHYFEVFYNMVHAYGYDACLYSSKNFLQNVWTNKNGHYVWLANYTSTTSYSGAYYMWQQSNTGTIPGVSGDVDLNVLYLDRYNFADN